MLKNGLADFAVFVNYTGDDHKNWNTLKAFNCHSRAEALGMAILNIRDTDPDAVIRSYMVMNVTDATAPVGI